MFRKKLLSAFTLVELLIVIAVMGVLAGAVLVSINPADKIAVANDAKVQADISQIATAVATYAVQNNGFYPAASGDLWGTNKELPVWPTAPTSYSAYALASLPAACTAGTTCTSTIVSGQLKGSKWVTAATLVWKWTSANGKTCAAAAATGDCP